MPNRFHNSNTSRTFRKALRNSLTPAEALLWRALQHSKLQGRKFRRQHGIGNLIVDFYCPSERIVIELDGAGHFSASGEDADLERDRVLRELGMKVLRFENQIVIKNMEHVLAAIEREFVELPSCEGGEDAEGGRGGC